MNEKKHSKKWINVLVGVGFVGIGAGCGVMIAEYVDRMLGDSILTGERIFYLAAAVVQLLVILQLQIVIHEAGHLIAGLLSGYRFSSFRIGNFMWLKENGKLRFCRLFIAGTGGQCLMNPPDLVDGRLPFVFYNLGGVLLNLATIPIGLVGMRYFEQKSFVSLFCLLMCMVGLAYAVMNGIPLNSGVINNDGCNVKELRKSEEALRAFWVQMKVAEQIARGIRLKDMPDEWFVLPGEDALKNSMTAVMAVFRENQLMDQHEFAEAEALMDRLFCTETGIVGLHQRMLLCDRLYCELLKGGKQEKIDKLYSKEQIHFMKQMRNFPSVLRTDYAYTLLYKKDMEKAQQIKGMFEKCAKKYPYPADVESERELMEIAENLML